MNNDVQFYKKDRTVADLAPQRTTIGSDNMQEMAMRQAAAQRFQAPQGAPNPMAGMSLSERTAKALEPYLANAQALAEQGLKPPMPNQGGY